MATANQARASAKKQIRKAEKKLRLEAQAAELGVSVTKLIAIRAQEAMEASAARQAEFKAGQIFPSPNRGRRWSFALGRYFTD